MRFFVIDFNYLGTPESAYDSQGNKVWSCELDIYGKIKHLEGDAHFVPFRYQGQYHDTEIDLYYNRFRYYSPEIGTYISKDPIGLFGNNPNFYAYVNNTNTSIDPLGLATATLVQYALRDGGNHYAVRIPTAKGFKETHLRKDGEIIELQTKGVSSKPTTGEIEFTTTTHPNKTVSEVNSIANRKPGKGKDGLKGVYTGQKYDLNTKDCFTYAIDVLKKLGVDIPDAIDLPGNTNAEKFDKLKEKHSH